MVPATFNGAPKNYLRTTKTEVNRPKERRYGQKVDRLGLGLDTPLKSSTTLNY